MKIKEKGLTGNAAKMRKESMAGTGRKGFNAFREMGLLDDKGKKAAGAGKKGKEVFLDFLGARLVVHEADGGSVDAAAVPFVKGATLRFDGVEGDVSFDDIKVRPCREVIEP